LDTEFENFNKRHKDWLTVLPLLLPAIQAEIKYHNDSKINEVFVPEYANLSTWINQRRWETEFPNPSTGPIHPASSYKQTNSTAVSRF